MDERELRPRPVFGARECLMLPAALCLGILWREVDVYKRQLRPRPLTLPREQTPGLPGTTPTEEQIRC